MRRLRQAIELIFVICHISPVNITTVNLNLLVAFEALLDERSVTRAARRTGVTQPAMSNTLTQLRALFEDPLFRRKAHGLEATPRALQLAEPVRHGLRILRGALVAPAFEPARAQRTFVLAASDYVELVLLPPLIAALAREAPSVTIEVRPWGLHKVPETLARAEVDLMIGFYDHVPAHHHAARLFEEEYVCIVRRGHPRVGEKLTLRDYLALDHVLVSQVGSSPGSVDRALAARGKQRRVAARVSHFLMVPTLVARTDLIAAVSRRVASSFAGPLRLRVLPPPLSLPRSTIGQVWHEQMDGDPGHRWLRGLIERLCREL
jgi:DNA-binding transcriptional LysR family regulator